MISSEESTSSPSKRSKQDKSKKKKKKTDRDEKPDIKGELGEILAEVGQELPLSLPEPEDVVQAIEETTLWPKEDLNTLLDRLAKLLPKYDMGKYTNTLKKVSWEDIKFNEYTANECKYQWQIIMDRLRHYRTLSDLVQDARSLVSNPYQNNVSVKRISHPDMPKKPLTPFFRYFIEKRERYKQKHSEATAPEIAKALSSKYANLSEKRKNKYKSIYDQEMGEYREKLKKFKKEHPEYDTPSVGQKNGCEPAKPKTPFQLFLQEKEKKRDENTSKKENLETLRKVWSEMSENKRFKWIKKALADEERYLREVELFKSQHPEFEPPTVKVLNKAEKELKEKMDGRPDRPPNNGYALFSKIMFKEEQNLPSKERMSQIAKKWQELTQEEKDKYNKQAAEDLIKYNELLSNYLKNLPSEEREKILAEERNKVPTTERLKKYLNKLQS